MGEILLGVSQSEYMGWVLQWNDLCKNAKLCVGATPAVGLSARQTGTQVDDLGVGEAVKCSWTQNGAVQMDLKFCKKF